MGIWTLKGPGQTSRAGARKHQSTLPRLTDTIGSMSGTHVFCIQKGIVQDTMRRQIRRMGAVAEIAHMWSPATFWLQTCSPQAIPNSKTARIQHTRPLRVELGRPQVARGAPSYHSLLRSFCTCKVATMPYLPT